MSSSLILSMKKPDSLKLNPFLHFGSKTVYNPLTDKSLKSGDSGFETLTQLREEVTSFPQLPSEILMQLFRDEWLIPFETDLSSSFFLKYASIETHTVCNFACRFCPVSLSRREPYSMTTDLFERIVADLKNFRKTLMGIILTSYNEPTLDERFIDQVVTIKQAGLALAVLTNGSELTPKKIEQLIEIGGLSYLAVNISTLDKKIFRHEHGVDLMDRVIGNLDYAKKCKVADEMAIVVLGMGDDEHHNNFRAIRDRFAGTYFEVKLFRTLDRAGLLDSGLKPEAPLKRLCGCENMGSRPLQHIHITSHGKCILCCQDYLEDYTVGDLQTQSIQDVLSGPKMAELREFCYGLKKAPDDFICRRCASARPCL